MGHHQGLGLLLLAAGIFIISALTRFWSHTKKDPRWIWRGELGAVLGDHLRPGAIELMNALLLILGSLVGAIALGAGFLVLRWF